jgi:hypothetical protein
MGLLETTLAAALLLIALEIVFQLFMLGAQSFLAGERQHDLSRQATIALERLTRQLESAPAPSLSLAPEAVSFLSCRDNQNQSQLTTGGDPLWQAYQIYYRDSSSGELKQRRIALGTPSTAVRPIEETDLGSGPQPLPIYLVSTEVVARNLTRFSLSRSDNLRFDLEFSFDLPAQGRQTARHLEVKTAVVLRLP